MLDEDIEVRIPFTNTGHYIITIDSNGVVTATCDGTNITPSSNDPMESLIRLSLFVVDADNHIKFKDLKVYPI